jgi:uncharacterized SAM-binding protein YcdF (DUF218 family)
MRRLLLAGIVGATALAALGPAAGPFLVVADPLPPTADAIVILAGSVRDRAYEAAQLYREGRAARVVVTREALPPGDALLRTHGVEVPDTDALTRTVLIGLGVPPRAITTLRRRTYSTASEASTIARWACRQRVRELIVVTSPPHTRRARLVLERALGSAITVRVRPARTDSFSGRRWYRVRRDAKTVLSEWQKLAHHWVRERWRLEECGGLRRRVRPPSLP